MASLRPIALLLFVAACGGEAPAPVPPVATPFGATLTDVTAESGITFVHGSGASARKWLPETMGSGVLMLDHDGDSLRRRRKPSSSRTPFTPPPERTSATSREPEASTWLLCPP